MPRESAAHRAVGPAFAIRQNAASAEFCKARFGWPMGAVESVFLGISARVWVASGPSDSWSSNFGAKWSRTVHELTNN